MITTRREVMAGGLAAVAAAVGGVPVWAAEEASAYFAGTAADNGVSYRTTNFSKINKKWQKQVVKYFSSEPQGTVVVDAINHFLYLDHGEQDGDPLWRRGRPRRLQVVRPRDDRRQGAMAEVDASTEMLERRPELPPFIAGGASDNPLGARAMYLHRDGVDTGYRLHGTVEPWNVGTNSSSGCIRMIQEHIIDLYQRCPIGTAVQVLPHIATAG